MHQAVAQQLIRAIEELEGRPRQRTQHELADKAVRSLSYDFPIVSTHELLALADTLRDGLQGKSGAGLLAYSITRKVLENVVQGARGPNPTASGGPAASPSAGASISGKVDEHTGAASSSSPGTATSSAAAAPAASPPAAGRGSAGGAAEGEAGGGAGGAAGPSAAQGAAAAQELKAAHQRVASVLLMQLVQHLLAVPELDAWQVVQGLAPPSDDDDGDEALQSAAAAQFSLAAAGHTAVYDAQESTHEDPDDFEFEPLEPVPTAAAVHHNPSGQKGGSANGHAHGPVMVGPPYSWTALHAVLMLLASQVDYSLMDDVSLWQEASVADTLLQAVRTLGAHSRAEELAPLLHAYAGLLVDHLLRQQAHIALLTQFWDAIGVSALAAMPRRAAPKQAKQAGADAGAALSERLPVAGEALLACNMAASLGVQLSAASARAGLWQAINGCLLPLAVRSLADLAAALPAPVGSAKASSSAAAPAASHAQPLAPALVAAMGSVCQVVVLYLQLRPGNVDAAATLQERGALAPLARLFLAAGAHAGAEPLRQALLCCAASSSATAKWLLAVPGVAATLQGSAFALDGPHQLHGAMWELLGPVPLLGPLPLPGPSAAAATAATAAAPPGAPASPAARAQAALADCESAEGVLRLHSFLELITMARTCSGAAGGLRLAPALLRVAQGALSRLLKPEALTALAAGVASGGGAAGDEAGGAPGPAPAAVADGGAGPHDQVGLHEAEVGSSTPVHGAHGAASSDLAAGAASLPLLMHGVDEDGDAKSAVLSQQQLQARRALQLQPACVRMLKTLCMAGAGKTD